jgi:hypothetical protein
MTAGLSARSDNSSNHTGNARSQNHSLRYATHQLIIPIGIVASSDHKMGKLKSAISPSTMKTAQKTLRCIPIF